VKRKIIYENKEIEIEIPSTRNKMRSIYVYGVHKSGSTLLTKVISDICQKIKMPSLKLESILFNNGIDINSNKNMLEQLYDLLNIRGIAYLGFRTPWFIPNKEENNKKILLVRDPRDAVISYYFSDKKTHNIPDGITGMAIARKKLENSSDVNGESEYIRRKIRWLKKSYSDYSPLYEDKNCRIYRYEDIIFQKQTWIRNMCNFLEMEISEEAISKIAKKHDVIPQKENENSHIRQVVPGNYKKYFNNDMIKLLNDEFSDILNQFGYNDVRYFGT